MYWIKFFHEVCLEFLIVLHTLALLILKKFIFWGVGCSLNLQNVILQELFYIYTVSGIFWGFELWFWHVLFCNRQVWFLLSKWYNLHYLSSWFLFSSGISYIWYNSLNNSKSAFLRFQHAHCLFLGVDMYMTCYWIDIGFLFLLCFLLFWLLSVLLLTQSMLWLLKSFIRTKGFGCCCMRVLISISKIFIGCRLDVDWTYS